MVSRLRSDLLRLLSLGTFVSLLIQSRTKLLEVPERTEALGQCVRVAVVRDRVSHSIDLRTFTDLSSLTHFKVRVVSSGYVEG